MQGWTCTKSAPQRKMPTFSVKPLVAQQRWQLGNTFCQLNTTLNGYSRPHAAATCHVTLQSDTDTTAVYNVAGCHTVGPVMWITSEGCCCTRLSGLNSDSLWMQPVKCETSVNSSNGLGIVWICQSWHLCGRFYRWSVFVILWISEVLLSRKGLWRTSCFISQAS